MIKHINYQTITQNGIPAFVVIPYNEFLQLYPMAKKDHYIPHEVVGLMINTEVSQVRAWREYLGLTKSQEKTLCKRSQLFLDLI